MASNPNGRWRVVPTPVNAPGRCFTCRGTQNGPFIQTGLFHEFYMDEPDPTRDGNVYLCSACIVDMFNVLAQDDGEFERRVADAHNSGVREGINIGEKILRGYIDDFTDSCLTVGRLSGRSIDILPVGDGQDKPEGQEDSESTDKSDGQADGAISSERPDGVSDDRNDAFSDLFS